MKKLLKWQKSTKMNMHILSFQRTYSLTKQFCSLHYCRHLCLPFQNTILNVCVVCSQNPQPSTLNNVICEFFPTSRSTTNVNVEEHRLLGIHAQTCTDQYRHGGPSPLVTEKGALDRGMLLIACLFASAQFVLILIFKHVVY